PGQFLRLAVSVLAHRLVIKGLPIGRLECRCGRCPISPSPLVGIGRSKFIDEGSRFRQMSALDGTPRVVVRALESLLLDLTSLRPYKSADVRERNACSGRGRCGDALANNRVFTHPQTTVDLSCHRVQRLELIRCGAPSGRGASGRTLL